MKTSEYRGTVSKKVSVRNGGRKRIRHQQAVVIHVRVVYSTVFRFNVTHDQSVNKRNTRTAA